MRRPTTLPGLTAVVALVVAWLCSGCADRAEDVRVPVPEWHAELPGKPAPLPIALPAHLDDQLPRAPRRYLSRTRLFVPPDLRGRAVSRPRRDRRPSPFFSIGVMAVVVLVVAVADADVVRS